MVKIKQFIIFTSVILVIVLIGVYVWGKDEMRGTIKSTDTGENEAERQESRVYKDDYLTWEYSPRYELRQVPTTDGRVLTNVELLGQGGLAIDYVVTLRWASQELADFSAVQFRRLRKDEYVEKVAEWGDFRGLLFLTEDQKERTVFFRKGGQILTVSMRSNSNDPELGEEFKNFWQSIAWNEK